MSWSGVDRRKVKHVLYLDDSDDDRRLFEITANSLGFQAKTVQYQSDFIKEFESGFYDAAFVDFILPIGDGVCLTRMLHRDRAPDTKLYIYTGYEKHLVVNKVNGDKINGVLSKCDGIQKALAGVVND